MARRPRLKVKGKQGSFHVVTRTRGRDFLLDDRMKSFFVHALRKLQRLFYVRYSHFCCLSNHYHILLGLKHPNEVDPREAMQRWNAYHDDMYKRNESVAAERDYVVGELTDISAFMKRLNMILTIKHNSMSGDTGTLWERRFRSVIVKRGWSSIRVGAYIDLNSFRASLTSRPEEYPYSSLNHLKRGNPLGLIDIDEVEHGLKRSRLYTKTHIKKAKEKKKPPQSSESPESPESPELRVKRIYETYCAIVYKFGTTPHRDEHGLPEKEGVVITEQMKERLKQSGIRLSRSDEGALSGRVQEYTTGKLIALSRQDAEEFYRKKMRAQKTQGIGTNPHREDSDGKQKQKRKAGNEKREKTGGIERWIYEMGQGQWSVCSKRSRGSPG